jgi:hypothetical protein
MYGVGASGLPRKSALAGALYTTEDGTLKDLQKKNAAHRTGFTESRTRE